MSETAYEGVYEITDQVGPRDSNFECSCGVLIWDIAAHIRYHTRYGELCEDKT
jgi:hypothetical protein